MKRKLAILLISTLFFVSTPWSISVNDTIVSDKIISPLVAIAELYSSDNPQISLTSASISDINSSSSNSETIEKGIIDDVYKNSSNNYIEKSNASSASSSLIHTISIQAAYNLVDEWSSTSNPTGPWSYGYKKSKTGTFNIYDKFVNDNNHSEWYSIQSWDLAPQIWKNNSIQSSYGVLPGEVSIHPGQNGEYSVVRWTSPINGIVPIAGHFGAGDTSAMGYYIYHNGISVWQQTEQTGNAYFSFNLSVEIGDVIDFMVGDYYWFGNTPIDITISTEDIGLSGENARHYCLQYDPATRKSSWVLEPIDAATGAQVIDKNLLTVNGARTIDFDVTYNSLLLNNGKLGRGWNHNFETRLEEQEDGSIKLVWNLNRINTFNTTDESTYHSDDQACRLDILVKNTDNSYTLSRNDDTVYQFDDAGKLTQLKNRNGQILNLNYDNQNRLTTITEPVSGKELTLTYNTNGFIDHIADDLNRQVTFIYTVSNDLSSITDTAGKTTTYTYDADGRVLTATDNDSNIIFTNTYDSESRVITQDDGISSNQLNTLTYDEVSQPGKIITSITDRNGKTSTLVHDNKYQLESITDALGNTTSYTYDGNGNRTSVTDALGNVTTITYDSQNNPLTITDQNGNTTTMTYDNRNNLLTITNPDGKTTTNTYDSNNNLLSTSDALNHTITFTYNTNSQLLTRTNPGGGVTQYTYQNGMVDAVTVANGMTSTYDYDAAGRVISVTNSFGKTVTMTYDSENNITSITDPLGNTVSYTYDCNGNKLSATDARNNITQYSYDANCNLISTKDPLNHETVYEYDGEGRLTKVTDALGNETTYGYDDSGRPVSVTDALGNTTVTHYDVVNNITGTTDALNKRVSSIEYDELYNPVEITDALGNTIYNQYDILNRIESSTDPLNRVTQYSYDNLNRLTGVTDPLEGESSQSFDNDGNKVSLEDPNSNNQEFEYDSAGRIIEVTTATEATTYTYAYNTTGLQVTTTNGNNQTSVLQYDYDDRLISKTDPAGTITYTYDPNGNVTAITDSSGTINYSYDALNHVTSYTDSRGHTIHYAYDAVGNLTKLTYPDNKKVTYQYDAANRLTTVTDWADRNTQYDYDANGRLVSTIRPDGSTETRAYDDAGQVIAINDLDQNGNTINLYDFTYDAVGNIISEIKNTESPVPDLDNIALTYGSDNRLATFNGETVTYDNEGNMITGPLAGQMITYSYDARNRLTSAGTTNYSYDAQNNRIAQNENGSTTSYIINPLSSLSQVLVKTDTQGNSSYYVYGLGLIGEQNGNGYITYHYDLRGSTTAISDQSGQVTDRYDYGPYGELLSHTGTTVTPFLYNGRDGVMNDNNGLYYMRARYYNPEINRFINRDVLVGSIDDGQSLNRFAYVNGNPVIGIDPLGQKEIISRANISIDNINVTLNKHQYTNLGLTVYELPCYKDLFNTDPYQAAKGYYERVNDYEDVEYNKLTYIGQSDISSLTAMDNVAGYNKFTNWTKAVVSITSDAVSVAKVAKIVRIGGGMAKVITKLGQEIMVPEYNILKNPAGVMNTYIAFYDVALDGDVYNMLRSLTPVVGSYDAVMNAINYNYKYEIDHYQLKACNR